MDRLFNILAQTTSDQSQTATVTFESFWDPTSIILCTAGVCVLVIWLFWFGGFGALKKAPVRRHRWWFVFWPLSILFLWIISMGIVQAIIDITIGSDSEPLSSIIDYPANAVIQIGLITAMLFIAHKSFARQLKGFGIQPGQLIKDVPLALVHLLAVLPLIIVSLCATLFIGQHLKGPEFNLEVHQSLDLLTDAGIGLQILVIIFAVLIVPVFEELLFRGFLQTSLRSLSGNPWIAIVLTSLFFAILHPPTHIPALFMLSCGLGYAYERSGSLLRPILMHIFFNGFNVAIALMQPA